MHASFAPDRIPELEHYFKSLQENILAGLGAIEPKPFSLEPWDFPDGGGGRSAFLEEGDVIEAGAVHFSHVEGAELPASARESRAVSGPYHATGLSMILHPENPYAPTVHMNVRFFVVGEEKPAWWFGGGMDLTPHYGFAEDAWHFHKICHEALAPFNRYEEYKSWCDKYFYLSHRGETRGIGGVFFDELSDLGFEQSFALTRRVGDAFLQAYVPILERRCRTPYGERERNFQSWRRSRYVEFNLLYDRGTRFGLASGGRTEAILASMPPVAVWKRKPPVAPGSDEEKFLREFLRPRMWYNPSLPNEIPEAGL